MPETDDITATIDCFDDPLFLSHSDQPTSQLTTYLFDGTDFLSWKQDVFMALTSKNKEGFLNGSVAKPPISDKNHKKWVRCDYMVLRWLLNSMVKSLRDNLKYVRSTKECWSELIERYGMPNAIEIYQLKKEMGSVKQDNLSLLEYYSKLKSLWETLDGIDPVPFCNCGKMDSCTCTLFKRLLDRENQSKMIDFLMGLNGGYENVRTQILSMEPLPSMNKVLGMLQKIERQKQVTDSMEVLSDISAYAASQQDKPVISKKPGTTGTLKVCSHCDGKGHNVDECWWLKTCPHCKKSGHKPENCYNVKGFPADRNKGKGRGGKTQGNRNVGKASAHNTEVFSDSPLDDPQEIQIDKGNNVVTSDMLDGLVSSVVSQVMKKIAEAGTTSTSAGLNSSNFAGSFQ